METIELKQGVIVKNILLATDFSNASKKAVPYAAAIARKYASKIHVVHVIPPLPRTPVPVVPLPGQYDRDRVNAELEMKTFLRGDALCNQPHEVRVEQGPIPETLSQLIERDEIELLVLGTHGRGGLRKIFLGSVAEELFRLASCPVLTVGPSVPAQAPKEFRRILFATDFGPASLHALPYAISLASESNARLTLLHVVSLAPILDVGPFSYNGADVVERQKKAKTRYIERLRQLLEGDENLPFEPEFLVSFDFTPDSIVNIAADCKADLIVMGVNQTAWVRASAHIPWATAHEVVCHARCPVLTVRS